LSKHDEQFRDACNNRPGNAQYTSGQIQNEFIELCGDQVLDQIIAEVKEAGPFSIIADETSDTFSHEQVGTNLRYTKLNGNLEIY
jgi:hypothetical protein